MTDTLRFSRIVRTADDGSRFVDAELELTESTPATGARPMAVAGMSTAATVTYLRSA
ncbi:hypothetical protein AB0L63_26220 [Nocardia sp. NPDC051990]|uniref:hypothetical protein n=1 Tax=Nocardia sp. NPDC051990 TaxID=3155285 RepID=UPI0034491C98